jgi:hypothetical protein
VEDLFLDLQHKENTIEEYIRGATEVSNVERLWAVA